MTEPIEMLTDTIPVSGWTLKAEGKERNRKVTITCALPTECPLLAKGLCIHRAHVGGFLSRRPCAFGQQHWTSGLTARANGANAENQRDQDRIASMRDGKGPADKFYPSSMIEIGGLVMLPYDFMKEVKGVPWPEPGVTEYGGPWMRIKDITAEVVVTLAEARPRTWLGNEYLREYPVKSVPRFLYDLKHWFPEIYAAACKLSSSIERMTADVEFFKNEKVPVAALAEPTEIDGVGGGEVKGTVYFGREGWELATDHAGIVFWTGRDTNRKTSVVYPLLDTALVHPTDPAVRQALYDSGAYCQTLIYKA